jgi:peptidyl-prolyl cis-trans isomerase B (cyclophilin B)
MALGSRSRGLQAAQARAILESARTEQDAAEIAAPLAEALRAWQVRVLAPAAEGSGKVVQWLRRQLADHRPRVQIEAARALARASGTGPALARGARRLWRSAAASHHRLTGAQLTGVLGVLRAMEAVADVPEVQELAADLLYLADASDAAVTYGPKEALAVDLVHCAAARLWDLGAASPEQTPTCGSADPAMASPARRRERTAALLGELLGRAEQGAEHLRILAPLLVDDAPRVREAALRGLAHAPPDLPQLRRGLRGWLHRGLADPDPRPVAAAAAVVVTHAGWLRQASRDGGHPPPAELQRLIAKQLQRLEQAGRARGWTDHRARAVCALEQARAALRGRRPARRCHRPAAWVPPAGDADPARLRVVTAKGVVEIELDVGAAPVAARALGFRARAGTYDGARVVVVDPTDRLAIDPVGAGTDAGGRLLPREPSGQPFVRGSVGLEEPVTGKAGSRLFITLARQPRLDGRRSHVGRVVRGADVLARLQPGDVISAAHPVTP